MSSSYKEIIKNIDELVNEKVVNFFIVFTFDFNQGTLQEIYRRDPQNFFSENNNSIETKKVAKIIIKVKKILQQILTNQDREIQKIMTFSSQLTNSVNLHVIIIQNHIFFVATQMNFFKFISRIGKESVEKNEIVTEEELNQQVLQLNQLINIEKMILQRIDKLDKIASSIIEVTKQLKEVLKEK